MLLSMAYVYRYAEDLGTPSTNYAYWLLLRLVDVVLGIVMLLLGARFILALLGARETGTFMASLHRMTDQLIAPFAGVFPTTILAGQFAIEWTVLFAMLVYGIVAYLAVRLVMMLLDPVR